MSRVERVEEDVAHFLVGEQRQVSLDDIDAVTYRAYLSRYAIKNNIRFKTKYDRENKMIFIRRVL